MEERVRVDPYLTVVVRPPTLVQLGAAATGAPVLRPPSWLPPDTAAGLVRWMQTYRTRREVERRAADSGMTEGDVAELLAELRAHGLLQREPAGAPLHVYLHGKGPVADSLLGELESVDAVRVSAGTARGWTPTGRGIDLAVLTDVLTPDPVLVRRLMLARVPHLPVLVRDGIGVVGPLVLPGASPCLRCLDHTRSDADPGWPTLACQLFGRTGRASDQVLRVTSAVAAQQVGAIAALRADEPAPGDGAGTALRSAPLDVLGCTLEVEGCGIAVRRWTMHPGCGCGRPADDTAAAATTG
ncbi:hypothetical protein [Tsukamurella sp. 1534]|uniref:hypothetical protein n=1 Tax=Tsukamurella sp. 1534 TaxID=1151061 RepID=UPI0003040185|nr:hypothetical protein [Tsukamurella sp. 1534]